MAGQHSDIDHTGLTGVTGLTDHTHAATGSGSNGGGASLAPTSLILPQGSSPAQTAEGSAVWDTDDDVLTVGTGAGRKTFGYLGSTVPGNTPGAASNGSGNEVARANHDHGISAGSGAGLVDFDQVRLTSGNKTLNSTSWTNLDTGMDLVLTAQNGDVCEVTLHGLYENQNVGAYIDCATWVSSAGVHWFGNGEPTSSTGNGVIGWSKPVAATTYQAFGASVAIVLASGDLSGGTVTLRLRYRTGAASNLTLRASSGDALIFQAKIWRP